MEEPPAYVPRSLENGLSLSCSKALNVSGTDFWKCELAPVKGSLGCHFTMK